MTGVQTCALPISVDFASRRRLLASLLTNADSDAAQRLPLIHDLVEQSTDGRLKLSTISHVLNLRRQNPDVWTTGSYVPLETTGSRKDHLCAFARQTDEHCFIVVVPRLSAQLTEFSGKPPLGPNVWSDTWLPLPGMLSRGWYRNVLTGEMLPVEPHTAGDGLNVGTVLRSFPVALLEHEPHHEFVAEHDH